MATECKHGQLARSCELCEKDARIADLESTLRELRIRLHCAGRRPEECYEMHLIDSVL